MTGKPLKPSPAVLTTAFFARPANLVARDLLGKTLVRRLNAKRQTFIVTETEAYLGTHDLASHSARGRTARTEVMFGPPGRLYIYLVYGLHWLLNVVTGPRDEAAAVLIRSAGIVSGPGRLGRALELTPALNGRPASTGAGLWFEDTALPPEGRILITPRIGLLTRVRSGLDAVCASFCLGHTSGRTKSSGRLSWPPGRSNYRAEPQGSP